MRDAPMRRNKTETNKMSVYVAMRIHYSMSAIHVVGILYGMKALFLSKSRHVVLEPTV